MTQVPKRRLGRGLAALIGDDPPEDTYAVPPAQDEGQSLRTIPVENLVPNPSNPRKKFTADELQNLAQSIKDKGLLQPLVVRPRGDGSYEIVAGERRWRAAQLAQIHEVPVLIRELDDKETLEIALIENIQRSDLNPLEEAAAYRQLIEQYAYTQQQLADGLGKSRSHIANVLRLLTLPSSVRAKIEEGLLSAGHARAIVTTDNPNEIADQIIKLGMSVRQAEDLVRAETKKSKSKPAIKDADTRAMEKAIAEVLGMAAAINHKGDEGGTVVIKYKTLEQVELIYRRLTTRNPYTGF
jgi:ParB family transcriptional regulator, chromosome partitioning protein